MEVKSLSIFLECKRDASTRCVSRLILAPEAAS
jgi:hypothetical protein